MGVSDWPCQTCNGEGKAIRFPKRQDEFDPDFYVVTSLVCEDCDGTGRAARPEDPEPDSNATLGLLNPMTAPRRVGY